jgi:hypothetical protein
MHVRCRVCNHGPVAAAVGRDIFRQVLAGRENGIVEDDDWEIATDQPFCHFTLVDVLPAVRDWGSAFCDVGEVKNVRQWLGKSVFSCILALVVEGSVGHGTTGANKCSDASCTNRWHGICHQRPCDFWLGQHLDPKDVSRGGADILLAESKVVARVVVVG